MMMDCITLAGFILAVFGTGVAVGKIVEKIERLERKKEDEGHNNTSKTLKRKRVSSALQHFIIIILFLLRNGFYTG